MMEVSEEEYKQLKQDQRMLQALQTGGVDEWEYYVDTIEAFWDEEKDNE